VIVNHGVLCIEVDRTLLATILSLEIILDQLMALFGNSTTEQAPAGGLATGLSAMGLAPEVTSAPTSTPAAAPVMQGPAPQPVQYEQFSREFMSTASLDSFDGFRMEAGKTVTKNMQTSHSLFLGTQLRESGYLYTFGPTFHSNDGRTTMVGRVGLDGGVNARLIQKLGDSFDFKINVNSNLKDSQRNMSEIGLDYYGSNWACSNKLVYQGTCILNSSMSQEITKNLSLGGELTYVTANGVSIAGVGARYVLGNNYWSATLGRQPDFKNGPHMNTHSAKMQFLRRVSDRLNLGAELEVTSERESQMRMVYEYGFRHAKVQGMMDTTGKVSAFVSDFMGFGLSGSIDYMNNDYKFGFMMHVVPPPEQPQQ
jgi:mitochondrial import receptor subunit TOM40